jgi:ribonuclease VapC
MVIDTSALVAIALGEASSQPLLSHIEAATTRAISSVSLLEAGVVLRARAGGTAVPLLYQLVEELGSEVVSFDGLQAKLAIAAFGRFGKGMENRAQLNFGDCAVYALAQSRGEPVLATGNDFAATDLVAARP